MKIKINFIILLVIIYIIILLLFYNQFLYTYLKPLTYFYRDNSIINIHYNEIYNDILFDYKKTSINYIPILEINLPLYMTDIFYINILIFIFILFSIPILSVILYIKYKKNIFIFERKENQYTIFINNINFIFICTFIFYIISFIITLSLLHNNNMLLFEFDIQFNIQNYIYKYIYLLFIVYVCSLFFLNNIYYLKYNNIQYYILYILLAQYYDLIINLSIFIIQIFIYYIYGYLIHIYNMIILIKFYQTIIKRKI